MDVRTTGLALVLLAVLMLTATQLIIKTRLETHGAIPFAPGDLITYAWQLLHDWRLLLALAILVVAAFCWYAAVSRIPLSMAYPISALSYPLIFIGAVAVLREAFSWQALAGNALIVAGVLLVASAGQP